MRIIGLSGKIGTGKSFTTGLLLKRLGFGWKRRAFGDALKEAAANAFGFPISWAYKSKDAIINVMGISPYGFTPPKPAMTIRELLQWYGTEVCRTTVPGIWDDAMRRWLNIAELEGFEGVIIDDVRFLTEEWLVRKRGGQLVRLEPYPGWTCDEKTAAHVSETELDGYTGWSMQLTPAYGALDAAAAYIIDGLLTEEVTDG